MKFKFLEKNVHHKVKTVFVKSDGKDNNSQRKGAALPIVNVKIANAHGK